MKITTELFRSRIARRFCLLFFFCALIPTFCLFLLSFKRVTAQLEEQNYQRITQETKAYGISLFDRLIRVDNTLKSLLSTISSTEKADELLPAILDSSAEQIFVGIGFWQVEKSPRTLYGAFSAEDLASLQNDCRQSVKTRIVIRPGAEQVARVFFLIPQYRHNGLVSFLAAEAKPAYLWGVGTAPLLPPRTELSVYGDDGRRMIGAYFSPGAELRGIVRENVQSDLRLFKYSVEGERFLASSWGLFVKSSFANETWTIILSEAEQSIRSGIDDFRNTFLLITSLALLLTLFLSLTLIRRNLEPLNLLKKGTEQIARQDFSVRLDIRSDDEFADLGASFNSMTMQLQKQFKALAAIDRISLAILSTLDQGRVIDTSLKMLKEYFQADMVLLGRLLEPDHERVKLHVLEGEQEPAIHYEILPAAEKHRLFNGNDRRYTILAADQGDLPGFLNSLQPKVYPFCICLPLIMERQMQSILILGYSQKQQHDEDELQQARQLADQITIGLSNAKLVADLEKLLNGTIEALARTVDAKSRWTAGHSERVAVLAGRIGKRLGLSERQTDMLNRGGLLHDIGKIGIPVTILDKAGQLNDEEYAEVRSHPAIGQKILEPIEAYRDIVPMIAQHHERYDGSGYPLGLKGAEIDFYARILIVADVYDALVSSRPYRAGWVQEKAIAHLSEGAGSLFDPDIVRAFREMVAEQQIWGEDDQVQPEPDQG